MKNENIQVDKFHLFYVEALMQDSSFPQICRIKPIFEDMTRHEFIDIIARMVETNDYELTQQFLYFLLLFRDMEHLQEYINSEDFTLEMLEKLMVFVYGYCTIHDHSTERIIDEILYFLENERLLELVLHSKVIARDKLLLFFIISRFDIELLNRYFARIKNVEEFINYFLKLPEEILRSIIARNYHLFQYIMLMMAEGDMEQAVSTEFYGRYRKDIEQFSKLSDIVRQYRKKANFEKEKDQPIDNRDMGRISYLVNMIRELPDPEKAIEYFDGEQIFMDELEKKIVYAVVTDPLLADTFKRYGHMLDV